MKHNCNKKECLNAATYQLRLSLAIHANHEPALSTPFLYLCEEHKNDITFESVTDGYNWDKICLSFESIGRIAPKKEFSKLIIEPIP